MTDERPFPNLAVINLAEKHLSPTSLVLDVGCNYGQTGEILKKRVGCRVVGIDNSPQAVKEARKILDKVIFADVESDKFNLGGKLFDLIILSNILEHLKDPLLALRRFKKYLKRDGYLLIALPNIAFWSIRRNLLLGRFEYQNEGILNQEHLRFFTHKTAKELIKRAGLKIEEETTNYLGWRAKIASLWSTLLASQFLLVCKNNPVHK